MALAVPLSRFTPRVGDGSAFYVRHRELFMNSQASLTSEGFRKVCRYAGCACSICVITRFTLDMVGYDGDLGPLIRAASSFGAVVSALVCLAFGAIGIVKRKEL